MFSGDGYDCDVTAAGPCLRSKGLWEQRYLDDVIPKKIDQLQSFVGVMFVLIGSIPFGAALWSSSS